MGISLCVLFLMWFLSGLVLMYCDFPAVSEENRFDHLALLQKDMVSIPPAAAAERVGMSNPTEVRLSSILSRPVYRFRAGRQIAVVYADSGEIFHGFEESQARQIGAAWVHLRPEDARLESRQIHEDDQWTVQQHYQLYRPLWKFSWPSGEVTYISDVSGEVVQYTTRSSRLGAYLGAIPHWIYITRLRRNAAAWSRLVILLSGAGTVLTLLGLIVGLWMYSPSKRYRFQKSPSHIPYSGQLRWHMILGLTFGFVTFTWILSGMFSMDPIEWPENTIETKVEQNLLGANWSGNDFGSIENTLAELQKHLQIRELLLTYFGGKPIYIALASPSETVILVERGSVQTFLDPQIVRSIVAQTARPYAITESRLVTRYEVYYVDRKNRLRLPVLYLRLDDPQQSIFYIDLFSGGIARSYSRWQRLDHWLYEGPHDFDIPWFYRYRPLWDVIVIFCLAGGTWLSISGIIIGWRRVRRII